MISAWWLLLIIPICSFAGYALCGVMSSGSQADDCSKCIYNAHNKEKSK